MRSSTIRPQLEELDDRRVPAGNVAASGGAVLQLRGDEAANHVRITQDAARSILVEGLHGTRINGQTAVRFDGSDLEKVDVLLFGGNDSLVARNVRASADITIETGAGNDAVRLFNTLSGVVTTVKTDDGTDRVVASGIRTGTDFNVETGQGISNVTVGGSAIGGALNVIGLDGSDSVSVTNTTVRYDLKVNTGKGNDVVMIGTVAVGLSATIVTDLGHDRVGVRGLTTNEDLNVDAGEGDDRVGLTNVTSHKNIKVDVQTGNDFVGVTNVRAAKDAVFLGGDGFDTFDNNGVSGGEKLEIKEFNRFV